MYGSSTQRRLRALVRVLQRQGLAAISSRQSAHQSSRTLARVLSSCRGGSMSTTTVAGQRRLISLDRNGSCTMTPCIRSLATASSHTVSERYNEKMKSTLLRSVENVSNLEGAQQVLLKCARHNGEVTAMADKKLKDMGFEVGLETRCEAVKLLQCQSNGVEEGASLQDYLRTLSSSELAGVLSHIADDLVWCREITKASSSTGTSSNGSVGTDEYATRAHVAQGIVRAVLPVVIDIDKATENAWQRTDSGDGTATQDKGTNDGSSSSTTASRAARLVQNLSTRAPQPDSQLLGSAVGDATESSETSSAQLLAELPRLQHTQSLGSLLRPNEPMPHVVNDAVLFECAKVVGVLPTHTRDMLIRDVLQHMVNRNLTGHPHLADFALNLVGTPDITSLETSWKDHTSSDNAHVSMPQAPVSAHWLRDIVALLHVLDVPLTKSHVTKLLHLAAASCNNEDAFATLIPVLNFVFPTLSSLRSYIRGLDGQSSEMDTSTSTSGEDFPFSAQSSSNPQHQSQPLQPHITTAEHIRDINPAFQHDYFGTYPPHTLQVYHPFTQSQLSATTPISAPTAARVEEWFQPFETDPSQFWSMLAMYCATKPDDVALSHAVYCMSERNLNLTAFMQNTIAQRLTSNDNIVSTKRLLDITSHDPQVNAVLSLVAACSRKQSPYHAHLILSEWLASAHTVPTGVRDELWSHTLLAYKPSQNEELAAAFVNSQQQTPPVELSAAATRHLAAIFLQTAVDSSVNSVESSVDSGKLASPTPKEGESVAQTLTEDAVGSELVLERSPVSWDLAESLFEKTMALPSTHLEEKITVCHAVASSARALHVDQRVSNLVLRHMQRLKKELLASDNQELKQRLAPLLISDIMLLDIVHSDAVSAKSYIAVMKEFAISPSTDQAAQETMGLVLCAIAQQNDETLLPQLRTALRVMKAMDLNTSKVAMYCLTSLGKHADTEPIGTLHTEIVKSHTKLRTFEHAQFLAAIAKGGNLQRLMDSYSLLRDQGIYFPRFALEHMTKLMSEQGHLEGATKMFKLMIEAGQKPLAAVYNTIFEAVTTVDELESVQPLLQDMENKGVSPNSYTFTVLAKKYLRFDMPVKAANILSVMHSRDLPLIDEAVTTWTRALLQCGTQHFPQIVSLFHELQQTKRPLDSGVYQALAFACAQKLKVAHDEEAQKTSIPMFKKYKREADGADKMIQELYEHVVADARSPPPTPAFLNLCLRCCEYTGNLELAESIMMEFNHRVLTPTYNTFASLLGAYGRADKLSQMRQTFDDMLAHDIQPDVSVITKMIFHYGRHRRIDEAMEIYDIMVARGIVPNQELNSVLIDVCHIDRTSVMINYERFLKAAHR
eukprot:m.171970 g.171970  ORF g.171970 m.171970 type:complete len:1347 (+) comp14567_c0_seq2:143-4183(+)